MTKINPEVIGFHYVDNIFYGRENLKSMGRAKFGHKWKGYIKEMTYVHSEGFVTKILVPIEGLPSTKFRES